MNELAIVFFHHKNDPGTRHRFGLMRRHNPGVPVVAIHCQDGKPCDPMPGSIEVPRTFDRGHNWQNADAVYLEWFRGPNRVEAERYVFFEYDTHCTTSVKEWYAEVWDRPAVAPKVELRGRDRWGWFSQVQFMPREWQQHAAGFSPLNGIMLSRAAIESMAAEPLTEGVFCELRMATLAHWCGWELSALPPDKAGPMMYSQQDRIVPAGRPGIYHPVRTSTDAQPVVVLPYYGEFGWMIARHVRWVHQLQAGHKVVCCRRGDECLYPTADEFFYDWPEGLPDAQRCEDGHGDDEAIRAMIRPNYPEHEVVRPSYANPWAWDHADTVKFKPAARAVLPRVDVALCPRRRDHGAEKNWPHWTAVADAIRAAGFTVGLVGAEATSYADTPADTRAWEHPDGHTAGTVDVLTRCRLYVGGDTGVSHLAALADVPTVLFAPPRDVHGWSFADLIRKANRADFNLLPESAWTSPAEVIAAVTNALRIDTTQRPTSPAPWGNGRGPELWAKVHTATGITREWIDDFTRSIQCGPCRGHWLDMVRTTPPPIGDDDAMFTWGVHRHNEVNRRIGKPELPTDLARRFWRPSVAA